MSAQSPASMSDATPTRNVDAQEIAKFEALADKWWDTESEFRPLHQINPLRLNWISDKVGGLTGQRVLDVGCGGGILAESMARRGAQVLGIDMGEALWRLDACMPKNRGSTALNIVKFRSKNWRNRCRTTLMWSPAWKCLSMYPTLHPSCWRV